MSAAPPFDFNSDSVVQFLVNSAQKNSFIKKLILFGSRARGDHHERSDYDVAVELCDVQAWPSWALETRENVPTLCGLDLVKLDQDMSEDFKKVIKAEGVVIYDRSQSKS